MDCVVVDLDLRDGSGFEVLLDLVPDRHNPSIAVVVLTKLGYRSLHEMAVYHGANACLVKEHTTAQDLHMAIQKAIAAIPPLAR
jgi:DNA-binding NarL/FixJ family response regulator